MKHKVVFTIFYALYGILILLTPTVFYDGTILANLIIKSIIAFIPLMLYVFDADMMLCSITQIITFFSNPRKSEVVHVIKDNSHLFPIPCLSILKHFNYKFDSPQSLRKISSKIVKFADNHKLNLKPVRQLSGLRVNSFVYAVHDYIQENKNGTTKKIPPKDLALSNLANELKRPLGGAHEVEYSLVPGSANIQYVTAAKNQNKAGLGNILRSPEYEKVIQRNKLGQVVNLPAGLGVDLQGNPSVIDLKKGPHFRLIGSTGSGKSVAATTILASLLCLLPPEEFQVHIIDLKMVDFTLLEREFPHVKSLSLDIESTEDTLDAIIEEMNKRYAFLKDVGLKNTVEYNMNVSNKEDYIPQILLLIDEYSELLGSHPKPEVITKKIIRIAQLSRASGITLILGSQRLDSGVTNPLIKTNCPGCFALKTGTNSDSRVAIDKGGCEKLLGHGDCLLKFDDQINRMQFCMVSDDELKRLGKLWRNYKA